MDKLVHTVLHGLWIFIVGLLAVVGVVVAALATLLAATIAPHFIAKAYQGILGWWRGSSILVATLKRILVALLLLAVAVSLIFAIQIIPEWQVKRANVRPTISTQPTDLTPLTVANLQNDLRKTFLQVVGGAFAMLALYLTYRRTKVSEQGHITDRYTKAIEQLGATKEMNGETQPNIEVRLGAIYALERIAQDSARDHWTIMEVLTAYIRQNAPAPAIASEQTRESIEADVVKGPATDIQAILTVLGRRKRGHERERDGHRLDLSKSDLRRAVFVELHMENVIFREANLQKANFYKARLEGASFRGAHLEEAFIGYANANGTSFWGAHAQGARFTQSRMKNALFREAYLGGASFIEVKGLEEARIMEAHDWDHAFYDDEFARAMGLAPRKRED